MAKTNICTHCGHHQLEKIGVPGIRRCTECKQLVDLRSMHWLKRLMNQLAA